MFNSRDHLSFIHGCLKHYCVDAPLYGNLSMCIDSFLKEHTGNSN